MQQDGHVRDLTLPLTRLNAVRVIAVLFIAFGYASTMPLGPGNPEMLAHLGYDPSWLGIQVIFFFSGFLAMRSLARGSTAFTYLRSRFLRNIPSLAAFTLIAVLIIYPALGLKSGSFNEIAIKLGRYFFETVSCVDPGRVLPGLLDDARYMCLIQGAVWTFRWGAIAHICAALGGQIGLLKDRRIVAALAAITIIGYFAAAYVYIKAEAAWLEKPVLALRLSWPFLAGMACFAYRNQLPASAKSRTAILAALGTSAVIWHTYLPWTPAIEILLTGFWIYAGLLLATSDTPKLAFLNHWPNLALGLYLANWPTSQLLLLGFPRLTPIELIAISLPISLGIAYAAHLLLTQKLNDFSDSLNAPLYRFKPVRFQPVK